MTQEELTELERTLKAATDPREQILMLNELSRAHVLVDPPKAARHAREALQRARWFKDDELIARSLYRAGDCALAENDFGAAERYLLEASQILATVADTTLEAHVCIKLREVYALTGRNDEALGWGLRSIDLVESSGDPVQRSFVYTGVADLYFSRGELVRAYDFICRAITLAESAGLIGELGRSMITRGLILNELGDLHGAMEEYEKALALCREAGDGAFVVACLGNIGNIHAYWKDYERARQYHLQTLELSIELGMVHHEVTAHLCIAQAHIHQEEFEAAIPHIERSLLLDANFGDPAQSAMVLRAAAQMYLKLKEYQRAAGYIASGLEIIARYPGLPYDISLHQIAAEIFEARGDIAGAFLQAKYLGELFLAEAKNNDMRIIAQMQGREEIERAERDVEDLRGREEALTMELQERTRELALLALNLAQNSEFIRDIRQRITLLSRDSTATLNQIIAEIDQRENTREYWRMFELQFKNVHHDFTTNLLKHYPDITKSELRICILLKINLSNKEIADLLSTGVRNVEQHRRNIRKKLRLTPDVDLATFLAKM
ncbi:MAG: tetratricopeptide repeat protein [Bacteroidota bacterium]